MRIIKSSMSIHGKNGQPHHHPLGGEHAHPPTQHGPAEEPGFRMCRTCYTVVDPEYTGDQCPECGTYIGQEGQA